MISLVPEINRNLNYSLDESNIDYYGLYKGNESGYQGWGRIFSQDQSSTVYKPLYISLNYTCFFASNSCIVDECGPLENYE